MKRFMDKLELTYKSVRIRNIQRLFNIVQLVLIIILSIIILALSGVSLKPFYFPLDFLFFFLIVMLLVFSLEAIVFRLLEIGYSKSESAIYLMAKNSLKRAIVLIIISALILATPLLVTYAKGELSQTANYQFGSPVTFTNRDRLALTETTGVLVSPYGGGSVNVWLLTAEEHNGVSTFACPPAGDVCPTDIVPSGTSRRIFFTPQEGYEEYVLHIEASSGSPIVPYTLEKEPSPFVISFIPILAAISIVAQGVWIGYLLPIMRKYASLSIYSRKYVREPVQPQAVPTPDQRVRFEVALPKGAPGEAYPESREEVATEVMDIDGVLADARHNFNKGNYDLALREFDRVLMAEQSNVMALAGKGKIYEVLKRHDTALECYNHILALNPEAYSSWIKTGDLLLLLGRKNEAAERYRTAMSLEPSSSAREKLASMEGDAQYLMSQATHLSGTGRFDEALSYYDRVLKDDAENVRALVGKSIALRGLKRLDEAEKVLKEVLAIDYYNSTALDGLVKCYDEKLMLNPRDEEIWIARGDLLVELGRNDEALRSFRTVLEINPNSDEVRIRIDDIGEEPAVTMDENEPIIQEFMRIPGIGRARAKALIDAGYASSAKLGEAKVDELMKVKGISERHAHGILASLRPVD